MRECQGSVWLQITGVFLSEDWPDGEWPLAEILRTDQHVRGVCYLPYQVEPCHACTSPHADCQISDQRKLQTALSIHQLPVSENTEISHFCPLRPSDASSFKEAAVQREVAMWKLIV